MPAKILIINPNSTSEMTTKIHNIARGFAQQDTDIKTVNPPLGPPSIQGPQDGLACLPHLFDLFEKETRETQYDAVVIACFDDTGLLELKAKSHIPVIGIGEAAFHAATMLGQTFSTVTTLSISIPIIEKNIQRYGFSGQSKRVRASEIPVLDVGAKTDTAIRNEVLRAIEDDKCDSVVLGCAGMADLASAMRFDFDIPVIDGVVAAVGFCETLIRVRAA